MTSQKPIPVISVAGKSKVGKTTFLVKLIRELKQRSYRVGVIKHSIHTFAFAEPQRDTWRHAEAGATAVAFASPHQVAILRHVDNEPSIDQIIPTLGQVDLVLTEGYKQEHKPKIEISRRERGTRLVCRTDEIIAVVSDHDIDLDVPHFGLDDAKGVATLIQELYLSRSSAK
jgi:molybdopterin-guanine dinucleotide biosynthesis protein B